MSGVEKRRKFQRRIEDFRCAHCGQDVRGDGFTNHCPVCLWSKHVDYAPGDRAAECGGLMEPIALLCEGERWKITQRCLVCGTEKNNKSQTQDSFEILVALAQKLAEKESKNRN